MTCRKPKPFNCSVTIEQPSTASGDANTYNEIDLYDDANWSEYCVRPAHRRPLRGNERIGNEQVIGDRLEAFEMWGDSETRHILLTYRLKYTDIDGTSHTLGIIDRQIDTTNKWVTIQAVENASVA